MIMRARRTFRTRLCSVVLTACMVGSLLPMSVLSLAAEGSHGHHLMMLA